MTYTEWNNAIGQYYFNLQQQGQTIYLYCDKQIMEDIGKQQNVANPFDDYILACQSVTKQGVFEWLTPYNGWYVQPQIAGSDYLTVLQGLESASGRKIRCKSKQVANDFPLYLAYLCLSIIASQGRQVTITTFLQQNKLPPLHVMTGAMVQGKPKNWNHVWEALERWTVATKQGLLGIFEAQPHIYINFTYLTYPLSQTLLPRQTLHRLPYFFHASGFAPYSVYTDTDFQNVLQQYGNLLNLTINQQNNQDILINILRREYQNWNGVGYTQRYNTPNTTNIPSYSGTTAKLALCFTKQGNNFDLFYRLEIKEEYPENITFSNSKGIAFQPTEGNDKYSNRINNLHFPATGTFDDQANQWRAIAPQKDMWLFASGQPYAQNGWLEINHITSLGKFWLLYPTNHQQVPQILAWAKQLQNFTQYTRADGYTFPIGYEMIYFENPSSSCFPIPSLNLFAVQTPVEVLGGIPIGYRKYLYMTTCLPKVKISEPVTRLQIQLANDTYIDLQGTTEPDIWNFPHNIPTNQAFTFYDNRKQINTFQHELVSLAMASNIIAPCTDKSGQVSLHPNEPYRQGNNFVGYISVPDDIQQQYKNNFSMQINSSMRLQRKNAQYNVCLEDTLLYALTHEQKLSYDAFFELYDNIKSRQATPTYATNEKRGVLYSFRNLGFATLDSQQRTIHINPPALITIPNTLYPCAILTGARTPDLVQNIIQETNHLGGRVQINNQPLSPHVLPTRIEVNATNVTHLDMIAKKCGLQLQTLDYQLNLLWLFDDLATYQNNLPTNQKIPPYVQHQGKGWKIFDAFELCFKTYQGNFQEPFALLEYTRTPYNIEYWLIIQNPQGYSYFRVEKSIGRYLVLAHQNRQVLLYEKNSQKLLVPMQTPLPALLAEGFIMLSGEVPTYTRHQNKDYFAFSNLPQNFCFSILQSKLNQTPQII